MFVYILLAIALLSAGVFFLPVRAKYPFTLVLICLTAMASLAGAFSQLTGGEAVVFEKFPETILGQTSMAADSLSSLFIIIVSLAAVSVAVYSGGYLKNYRSSKSSSQLSLHYMALVVLFISMIFVVVCRDAFTFLFAWELMTISSFLLILFEGEKREVRRAALNYLVLMHMGFVFLLAGFILPGSLGYGYGFEGLAGWFAEKSAMPLFLLFFVGFGMKAGIFPLHTWLPEAHPAAPAHVSAFMSGVMIKMGVYGIIRVLTCMPADIMGIGMLLFIAGIVTGLWGAFLAAVQNDIKRLLAYSSIENIGIIFTALGASVIGKASGNEFLALCGMAGAMLHILNHSFFKSLLFFGAGNVYTATHTTSLDELGGLSRRMPVTSGLFLIGVIAISALPPLSGFVSELLIYYGLFDTLALGDGGIIAAICGIVALSLIGGVVILAFTKLFGVTFLGSPRSHAVEHAEEVSAGRLAACALPVAGIFLVGLAPFLWTGYFFSLAGDVTGIAGTSEYYGKINPGMWRTALTAGILIGTTLLLYIYRRMKLRRRVVERSPVWGCGFGASSHKMQYSGESYSEGLYGISTSLTKEGGNGEVVDKNEIFPGKHSFNVRHKDKVNTLFSKWWVELVRSVNVRVMRLNTGKINHYIMYALLFLVAVLVLSILEVI